MITEHGGPYGRNEGQDPTRLPDVSGLSASSPHDYRRLDATPETSAAMIREHAPKTAAVIERALRDERNHWIGEAKRYERLYRSASEDKSRWFRRMKDAEAALARTLDTDGGER